MKLAIRIQNVEERKPWAEKMVKLMDNDPRIKIITDDKHILWEGAKKTLTSTDPDDTHILVLQDDVLPCIDFIPAVERIIEALPNDVISLFSIRESMLEAQIKNCNYFRVRTWRMAQAYIAPVKTVKEFLAWSEEHIKPDIYFDDDRWAMFLFYQQYKTYCTAPALVEHLGWESTTLTGYKVGHVFKPQNRLSRWFIGIKDSALNIDWSKTKYIDDNEGSYGEFINNYK